MQARQNKILALSFVLLVSITAILLYVGAGSEQEQVDKNLFKVADLKSIDKVVLQSSDDTVELSYSGSRWVVNNSATADRDLIDVLFATLLQAEPRRPVSESKKDSILQTIHTTGTNVSLYVDDQIQKQFRAGGNETKTQGYYATGNEAYVVNIPGYKVYVPGIFELKQQQWYDRFVFALNWTNFKKLDVTFPAKHNDNFEVQLSDGLFEVAGVSTDTTRLNDFLDAVSFFTVDEYLTSDTIKTDIVQQITITDLANRMYSVGISAVQTSGKTACKVNDKHWAWVNDNKLARLVRPRSFYTKKP